MSTDDAKAKAKDGSATQSNAVLEENIRKEMRFYRPYDSYMVTPSLKKNFVTSEKPNTISVQTRSQEAGDEEYIKLALAAQSLPRERYKVPLTSAQEIGWDASLLLKPSKDPRFHHPKIQTDITKFFVKAAKQEAGK